jgi:hypothetical protein
MIQIWTKTFVGAALVTACAGAPPSGMTSLAPAPAPEPLMPASVRVTTNAATTAAVASSTSASPLATSPTGGIPSPPAAAGALANFATIRESPSTNTPGVVIFVRADGIAHWDTGEKDSGRGIRLCRQDHGEVTLGTAATNLLNHIPSDVRLADLPVETCAKPASFRTKTTLDHFGDTSGDLSCIPSDPRTAALARQVMDVKRAVLAACR